MPGVSAPGGRRRAARYVRPPGRRLSEDRPCQAMRARSRPDAPPAARGTACLPPASATGPAVPSAAPHFAWPSSPPDAGLAIFTIRPRKMTFFVGSTKVQTTSSWLPGLGSSVAVTRVIPSLTKRRLSNVHAQCRRSRAFLCRAMSAMSLTPRRLAAVHFARQVDNSRGRLGRFLSPFWHELLMATEAIGILSALPVGNSPS